MVSFASRWIAANALGWAAGFPTFLLFTERVFGHETHAAALGGHVVGLAVFGAVVGICQATALPRTAADTGRWIAAASAGFAAVNVLLAPLYWLKVWPAPGPVEPLVITLTAALLAAIAQAATARIAFSRFRFVALSLAGAAVGVAAGAAAMMGLMEGLRANLSWEASMAIFGLIVGSVSGGITRRSIRDASPLHRELVAG